MGQDVGILDLTRGELGTRGSALIRAQEAREAAVLMGIRIRENAGMADAFFSNDEDHQRKLITYIRYYQPDIVIASALSDRHPDHGRAGRLTSDACFFSGLAKIVTEWEGKPQLPWRPGRVYHMMQDRATEPAFIVDISDTFETKMEAIRCYRSQFHNPLSDEPMTYLATKEFLNNIASRDALMGKRIGVKYAECFASENIPGISSLDSLVLPELP